MIFSLSSSYATLTFITQKGEKKDLKMIGWNIYIFIYLSLSASIYIYVYTYEIVF